MNDKAHHPGGVLWQDFIVGDHVLVVSERRPVRDFQGDVLLHAASASEATVYSPGSLTGALATVTPGDLLISEQEVRLVSESPLKQVSQGFLVLHTRSDGDARGLTGGGRLVPALLFWCIHTLWPRPADRRTVLRSPRAAQRALNEQNLRLPADGETQRRLAERIRRRMTEALAAAEAAVTLAADLSALSNQVVGDSEAAQQVRRAAVLSRELRVLWQALVPALVRETMRGAV